MRQITKEAIRAFYEKRSFKKSNTEVMHDSSFNITYLYLFGNLIAKMEPDGSVKITNAGYETNTTKERLNGLKGVNIYQRQRQWYLNGEYWGGQWQYVYKNLMPSQLELAFA